MLAESCSHLGIELGLPFVFIPGLPPLLLLCIDKALDFVLLLLSRAAHRTKPKAYHVLFGLDLVAGALFAVFDLSQDT
jgi:hypothetical protein